MVFSRLVLVKTYLASVDIFFHVYPSAFSAFEISCFWKTTASPKFIARKMM